MLRTLLTNATTHATATLHSASQTLQHFVHRVWNEWTRRFMPGLGQHLRATNEVDVGSDTEANPRPLHMQSSDDAHAHRTPKGRMGQHDSDSEDEASQHDRPWMRMGPEDSPWQKQQSGGRRENEMESDVGDGVDEDENEDEAESLWRLRLQRARWNMM